LTKQSAAGLGGDWSADYSTPGSESRAAAELLQERFPERNPETVDVVWQAPDGAGSPAVAQRIDRLVAGADGLEGIGRGGGAAEAELSADGTIGVLRIPLTELPGAIPHASGERLIELAEQSSGAGLRIELGGQLIANAQEGEISSEMVGLAIAALVLLLTFGSVVAAGMPLATALFGLGISGALIGLLAAVLDVPDWAPALASMLGIGVGIDYALLIVTRYRGALAAGRAPREAVVESIATAGRSVLIAGTTVVISLLGLFLMGLPYLYGAALATIASVLVVMAASVTLVPALMAIAGPRIDRLRIPGTGRAAGDPESAPAARWGRAVLGGRGSPRSRASRCCWCSRRRSQACGSASPTAATTRPTRPRGRRTTSSRRASGRARTARCCSLRRRQTRTTATRWPRWPTACASSPEWLRSASPRRARRATPSC
jgi:RND superfamily putative drug exporter